MGTNYYVTVDPCPHCGRGETTLHIGKSSFGWAFLFMEHHDYGLTSWAAWQEFLASDRAGPIKDEYGDTQTLDYLRELVEAKKGLLSSRTAPDDMWGPYSRTDHERDDAGGYRFSNREFS